MTDARHNKNVQIIREALSAPFKAGDALLEEVPMGRNRANNATGAALKHLAEEVGVGMKTLALYRDVAHAWPLPTRVGSVSWTVHRELLGYPNKQRFLLQLVRKYGGTVTVNQVREETGRAPANYAKDTEPVDLNEAWAKVGDQLSRLLYKVAKLNERTDKAASDELNAQARISYLIFQRISERQIEVEYRELIESVEGR